GGRGWRRAPGRRSSRLDLSGRLRRRVRELTKAHNDGVGALAGPVVVARRRADAVEGAVAAVLPGLPSTAVLAGLVGEGGEHAGAERELACTRPGHDTERAADLLVRVEEALELPEDPPPVELPEQRPPGEAFALGRVAVPLADREEQRALGVVPRLVGCGAGLDAVEELGEHVVHEAA